MEADSKQIINVNGRFRRYNEGLVPAISRGLMYGDGCFETFCSYQGHFFMLQEHLERLHKGTQFLGIDFPDDLQAGSIASLLKELLKENDLMNKKAIIRLQIWRNGRRGYATSNSCPNFSILASPASEKKAAYRLATVQIRRTPSLSLPSQFKFSNGINYITAANEAREKGADDALMQTVDGWISETTIANIFWMQNGIVYTPSAECDLLPGITRKIIIHCLNKGLNKSVQSGKFTIKQIKAADVVWICNSVKEIAPVYRLDEVIYEKKSSLLQKLQHQFKMFLKQQIT